MKKVGIVCCSNGQKQENKNVIEQLENTLLQIGLTPMFSNCIYEKEGIASGTSKERAECLMGFYRDESIEQIFDISGGDIANGVLPYLDYNIIAQSEKTFWGYSDLTTIINAIYTKTGRSSVLYQVRNLVYENGDKQVQNFTNTIQSLTTPAANNGHDLFDISYTFVQGNSMQGVVIGGNIRCFLKLAGTEYMPDFSDKILLLESLGGRVPQMETYLSQLQQLGAFNKVSGILLGTFTEMERENCSPNIVELVKQYVREDLPIAVTKDIGHGADSKAIVIGKKLILYENDIF
jgi:muramoyltetrapeptide carboxypeptidase LdcA involved in peptidoglycan recycling